MHQPKCPICFHLEYFEQPDKNQKTKFKNQHSFAEGPFKGVIFVAFKRSAFKNKIKERMICILKTKGCCWHSIQRYQISIFSGIGECWSFIVLLFNNDQRRERSWAFEHENELGNSEIHWLTSFSAYNLPVIKFSH